MGTHCGVSGRSRIVMSVTRLVKLGPAGMMIDTVGVRSGLGYGVADSVCTLKHIWLVRDGAL